MLQGSPRRLVASFVLGALATSLAACGIASQPIAPSSMGNAGILSRANTDNEHVFNLKFDNAPPVGFGGGRARPNVAAAADLRSKLSPVDDQGHLGACTGFAATGLAEYLERQKGMTDELSPGFVYILELKADGNPGV